MIDSPVPPPVTPRSEADQVTTAREKFHCPACGAEAHWNPGKQALICPFCGTESHVELPTRAADTTIVEHDLMAALDSVPDGERGWQAAKTTVRCQSCHAISVLNPEKVGSRCDFCGSAQLVPYEAIDDTFRPESLLALTISESQARDGIRAWYKRQWFAPNSLNARALTDTVHAVYLPYWTFDANVHARWTADSGTYYYTGTGKNRRRHVRWTPAAGELTHIFDDDLVPASEGVDPKWLRKIEPFPTSGLIPYDPGYLAGWTVERYQIDLKAAAQRSYEQMEAVIRQLCIQQIPGDTHRNLVVRSTYTNRKFKHVLMPIWLLTYTFGSQRYQVVMNGVTGQLVGGRPWSWIKIALAVIAGLIVLLFILSLQE